MNAERTLDASSNSNAEGRPVEREPDRNAEFVKLYAEAYPRLQFLLMALLPNRSHAADVLQETSVVLWSKFSTFESGTNFYAWASAIARLQTLKFYEQNSRSPKLFSLETLEQIALQVDKAGGADEPLVGALNECLERLSDADRALIRRRYDGEVSVQGMAAEIGVTPNMISKSLTRIRKILLACVQRAATSQG
ncbi:MAG: sigma-70 family RNA polymerase sigma factor [Planctomycetota bacterium]